MKKLALIGLMSILFVTLTFAQGDPKKAVKRAKSNLESYMLDQSKKFDKLIMAKKFIDFASKDETYGKKAKTWNIKGQIYNALSSNVQIQRITDPSYKDPYPDAAFTAYDAFQKALDLAEKKYQKKDALNGMSEAISGLSNAGIAAYSAKDYKKAYDAFNAGLEIHKLLKDNNKKSPFDDKAQYQNQLYITGLAALTSKMYDQAGKLFSQLKDDGFDKPEIYDGLYKVYKAKKNTEKAQAILDEGRKKYPDDKALMYSEINDYLSAGKTKELVSKLQNAIKGDPNNASLFATLGNVYDQLSQEAFKNKNIAEADKQFDLAKAAYDKAISLDPKNFATVYSLGTLYYNKAANLTAELKKLEDDISPAGMKKYDAAKAKMLEIFAQALPYFQKAEKLEPNDRNTLIALKEIYARQNKIALSKEYSAKLDKLTQKN